MKELCGDGGGPNHLASSWGLPHPVSSNSPRIIPWGLEEESQNQLFLVSVLPYRSPGKPVVCPDPIAEGKPGPQAPSPSLLARLSSLTPQVAAPRPCHGKGPQRCTPPCTQSHRFSSRRRPSKNSMAYYHLSRRERNGCSQRSSDSFNP